MDAQGLEARRKVLAELGERLRSPRPERRTAKNPKPPDFGLDLGEVFAYPAQGGKAFNAWFAGWEQAGFVPDGWGAMLVLALGRAYDWLPWCAVASLVVDPAREPTLEQAARSRLVSTRGARYCVPMKTHLKRMRMKSLGRVPIDPARAARAISDECAPEYAVANGWSFISVLSVGPPEGAGGPRVADLA